MPTQTEMPCKVSVIIKAYNEEKRIATTIETALAEVNKVGGEVILADSCSTDRTIEIASQFPILIVQPSNPETRCCGLGPQLGFEYSKGDYIYILDGDMEMVDDFLIQAVHFLDTNIEFAGVGGLINEKNTTSLEYIARIEKGSSHMRSGEVDRLDGGGLYRRTAIQEIGFLSNSKLHSYEEFDLAIRLRVLGWRLFRLPTFSVCHYGHSEPPYKLLVRRWKSKYVCGLGELLRASLGEPQLKFILINIHELRIYLLVIIWWILWILIFFSGFSYKHFLLTFTFLFPFITMCIKKKSFAKGMFSVISWCFNAAGLIRGYLSYNKSFKKIDSVVIKA